VISFRLRGSNALFDYLRQLSFTSTNPVIRSTVPLYVVHDSGKWSTIPHRKLDRFPPELRTTSTGTADRFTPESLDHLHRNWHPSDKRSNFLLTAKRDAAAAKRFLRNPMLRVTSVDRTRHIRLRWKRWQHSPRALRQCKHLNNLISKETSLAGQRLWIVSERVADVAGNRNSTHDPEGPSEMVGKRDAVGQAHFIAELFGLAV
jgi:hypothetical protein